VLSQDSIMWQVSHLQQVGFLHQENDTTCPVSGVDHPRLLDVAHVVS